MSHLFFYYYDLEVYFAQSKCQPKYFCLLCVVLHYLCFYIQATDLVICRETKIAVIVKRVHHRISLNLGIFAVSFSGTLIIHVIVMYVVLSSQINLMAFGAQTKTNNFSVSFVRPLCFYYPVIFFSLLVVN